MLAILALGAAVAGALIGPSRLAWDEWARGLAALVSWPTSSPPLEPARQAIVELRVWRTLTAAGVGSGLALAGAMLQGLFRNPLAAPSLLGLTSGASLGSTVAILLVGGYAPNLMVEVQGGAATWLVPTFAFLGALGTAALVAALAAPGGRISTPTLLLVGIAVNLCITGIVIALQSLVLADWEVSRAIQAWSYGWLEDRKGLHAATVWLGLLCAAGAVPFVARELDLFRGGEEDATALGVDAPRVRAVCLVASSLATACAVAVVGQIAFVGLIVPHLVRGLFGPLYVRLLPLSIPAGALFLVGADALQRALLADSAFPPGVLMSLIGGPFFVYLILRQRRVAWAW
jgi:iron complex transport system permease protein